VLHELGKYTLCTIAFRLLTIISQVLQVLIFCAPFFDFLDQVSKKKAHSFKSDTPLLDAM